MTKGNKIRLFIWGFVWLCVLGAVITGIYAFYKGYGVYGNIRQELLPIEDVFNNLNGVSKFKNSNVTIKTSINKKYLTVSYKSEKVKFTLNFEYKTRDNRKLLYLKYNDSNQSTTEYVIKEMIEAISVLNNRNEGDVFNRIEFDDLYDYTIDKGVSLTYDNTYKELEIDMNISLADNIIEKVTTFITQNDLRNMNNELFAKEKFDYSKFDILLHIVSYDDSYVIYIQNTKYDNDMYKSILSIINVLDITEADKNEFEINYPEISESKEFGNFKITVDDEAEDIDEFVLKDNIIKIEITKQKELEN